MDGDLPCCIISDGRIASTALLIGTRYLWIEFQFTHPVIRCMNKATSKQLLLLSLSKTLGDPLTELECATDRSVLIKASECECSVPTSISVIRHTHLCLPWSILSGNTSSYPAPVTVDNLTGLLLQGAVILLYSWSCMLLVPLKLILSWTWLLLTVFSFFADARQTHGPPKSVKQLNKLVWPKLVI